MKSLSDIIEERNEAVILEKIAAVEETLGDHPAVVETFDAALDLVKEAGIEDTSEAIDVAYALTLEHLGLTKTAEEVEMEKVAEELGQVAAHVAAAAGVTLGDLEKIASDEEAELFGRALAQAVVRVVENA
jgi:hypothetical protein